MAVTTLHASGAWLRAVWNFLLPRTWGQQHLPNSWHLSYKLRDVTSCSTVIQTIVHSLLTKPETKPHTKIRKKKWPLKHFTPEDDYNRLLCHICTYL